MGGRRRGKGGRGGRSIKKRSIKHKDTKDFQDRSWYYKKWIWGEISRGRKDQGFGWGIEGWRVVGGGWRVEWDWRRREKRGGRKEAGEKRNAGVKVSRES